MSRVRVSGVMLLVQRSKAVIPALVGFLFLVPLVVSDAGHGEEEKTEAVKYYVHNFTNSPIGSEYAMNRTAPAGETAYQHDRTADAGKPKIEYNFTTTDPLPHDWEIKGSQGQLKFFLKKLEPQAGAGVPALLVNVTFRLYARDSTGESLFGEGRKIGNLTTEATAVEFSTNYGPKLTLLKKGTTFRWNVQITGPGNVYEPGAAPYGVATNNEFLVSFTRVISNSIMFHEFGDTVATVTPGDPIRFNFTVARHNPGSSNVTLSVNGTLPPNATAILRTQAGAAVTGPFLVKQHDELLHSVTLEGGPFPVGNYSFDVNFLSNKGETGKLSFLAIVTEPPAPPKTEKGGVPGFEVVLALAAALVVVLRRRRAA